ncbi:MAG TPA: 6-phosphogluconolactonase [Candidatus Acidoferrum sp.]|nr:6-phosphogluconolactonase [Candidatus Acidoferrum sp.]
MPTPATQSNRQIQIFPDVNDIAARAAELILAAATAAVKENGRFTIALAGGSTPKTLYSLLAAEPYFSVMPWDKTYLFFGDERHVPPDDKDSNFRMANESMISKLSLKPEQVHRIKTENPDPEKAAQEYEQLLTSFFGLSSGQLPRFDVILIGMGDEGHMLSLFPGTKALHDDGRLVKSNWIGKLYTWRVTVTAPVANNSALAIFMVTKPDKALALKGVLEGPYEPEQLPSQLLQPANGKAFWLIDTAAAAKLDASSTK